MLKMKWNQMLDDYTIRSSQRTSSCHNRPSESITPTDEYSNDIVNHQWTGKIFLVRSFVKYLFRSSDFPHAEINSIALSLDTLDNIDYQCAIVGPTGLSVLFINQCWRVLDIQVQCTFRKQHFQYKSRFFLM